MSLDTDHIRATLDTIGGVSAEVKPTGNYDVQRQSLVWWFAEQEDRWNAHSVMLGCLAVFGWMPTILEGRTPRERCMSLQKAGCISQYLNAGDTENIPYDFVNSSAVGTSKFLHFWRPDQFPIWDINVSAALFRDSKRREKAAVYRLYRKSMLDIVGAGSTSQRQAMLLANEQKLFWYGRSILPAIRQNA